MTHNNEPPEFPGRFITAGHIFKNIDPQNLGIPERAGKDVCVWHFGDAQIFRPKDTDQFDVAVIELQNQDFITLAKAGWHFLSATNVTTNAAPSEQYIVAGYPYETVKNVNGVLTPAALMQLYTGPYDGEVENGRGEFDFFLRYNREAADTYGGRKATPDLGGVSGAAVYAVLPCTQAVWAPETILKVTGIEVAFVHSKYARVKSWALVSHVLSLIPNAQSPR